MASSMEILYARNSQKDSDNSCETTSLKAKRNTDSETVATLLIKKIISEIEDEKGDIVESLLDEFFNISHIFVKSWSSDSHTEQQETQFEIWRDAMYIAIEKDTKHSEEIIKLLLEFDFIWSVETEMNDRILHRLIRYEQKFNAKTMRLIEMLLKSGKINVNSPDKSGNTALHFAQDEKLVSLLIQYGADVNEKDNEGRTPLMPPWNKKQFSVLQTILKEARTSVDLEAVDCNGRTILMNAASDARLDVVKLLLNAGASVNLSDHLGFTALHHALYTRFDHYDHFPRNSEELKRRKEIFTIIFDAKDEQCDCYMQNKGWIAKRIEIVEMLLRIPDTVVNALSLEKFSPLDLAEAWIPQLPSSIIKALKDKGAGLSVFRQTETQSTSGFQLDVRCRFALQRSFGYVRGHCPVGVILPLDKFEKRLLTLIEAFQDQIVSGKDQQGRTALHWVAISFSIMSTVYYWGFPKIYKENDEWHLPKAIVKELIRIGCNVNETDVFGRTALHYANFILKDSLLSHGADASIKDKEENNAIDEIPQQSSTESSDIVETFIDRNDEICFLRLMNNKQMELEVQCVDFQVRAYYDDREFCPQTVPRLLWEKGEYTFNHPLVNQITNEVTYLMSAIAKEIERLDPRFAIRPEIVGSSNEGTKIDKPEEFDFCFVLAKISELCEVSQSPELPTGFVRLKRKPRKVGEESDFDSFFGKDEILNSEKLNWQFTTILNNALVYIESYKSLDYTLELPIQYIFEDLKKVSNIKLMIPLNSSSVKDISIDIVPCIHIDGWWPDGAVSNVSDEIKKFGCNLVFDRPQELYPWVPYSESCARISFSKAESDMIKQSCANAREAYMIGKTMIEKSNLDYEESSKYSLKNSLLYCIEALSPSSEKASQLGLSLEELESKFHQMDRYLWLNCLMRCRLEFVSQDFCPVYFLPNFNSPIGKRHLKEYSWNWMTRDFNPFPKLCKNAYAFYRCTANAISESCCHLPAPDPLWERFDRNQLIASLCEIAYSIRPSLKL